MAKLGVGVGQEFPLDDGKPDPNCRHDRQHRHWSDERGSFPASGPPHLLRILAALALAGLAIFAFTHLVFVAIGAIVLGVLYFGHRHGFDFSPTGKPPAQSP